MFVAYPLIQILQARALLLDFVFFLGSLLHRGLVSRVFRVAFVFLSGQGLRFANVGETRCRKLEAQSYLVFCRQLVLQTGLLILESAELFLKFVQIREAALGIVRTQQTFGAIAPSMDLPRFA